MWEITKFNIIYFVFVILVLKQSVITLSNIPTIYIIAITQKCMSLLIIQLCIIRSMHIRGGVKLCDQPCIQCVG